MRGIRDFPTCLALAESRPALKVRELTLEKYNDINYGYLRIHVDKEQLRIGFHQVGAQTLAQVLA